MGSPAMNFQFLQPWHAFLPREGGHVISLFGGGGKTSLLAAWSQVYRTEHVSVAVTTTTRTEPLAWPDAVRNWSDLQSGAPEPGEEVVFVRQGVHSDGKWRGLSPTQVDNLNRLWTDRLLLVEADGSSGRPVKLHRKNEPVWPIHNSLAVAVMGLAAIGKPLNEVLHRHGTLATPFGPAVADETILSWDHLFQLLTGESGYLARIPADVPPVLVLTQLKELEDSLGLFEFLHRVISETDVPIVVLCELGTDQPRFRTAYRTSAEEQNRARS